MSLNIINVIVWVAIIASAAWAYKDARKYEDAGVKVIPLRWALVVFGFWIVGFPMYLFKRRGYKEQAAGSTNSGPK